jgi:hypothetical protein
MLSFLPDRAVLAPAARSDAEMDLLRLPARVATFSEQPVNILNVLYQLS